MAVIQEFICLLKVDDLQKRILAMAGQDVDAYLMQMEEVHRRTQAEKQAEFQNRYSNHLNTGLV